jgi:hypothetical protein
VSRSRLAAAVAIPLLLAIGLAFTFLRGRQPADTAAPATVAQTTTTTPPPPTTSRPNPPKATGEDWLAIMTNILKFRHELYEHPQPDLLSQIYDKRCPCYQREFKALTDLKRRSLRFDGQRVEVLKAKQLGQAKDRPDDVAVEALIRTGMQVLVDSNGSVVKRVPGTGPKYQDYELIRGRDGRWRVLFELPVARGGSRP